MVLTDGLLSYYKIDETTGTAIDDAHGSDNMTASNSTILSGSAAGIINTCGDMSGGDYYCYTGEAPFGSLSAMSVSAWIKVDSFVGGEVFVGQWKNGGSDHEFIYMRTDGVNKIIVSTHNGSAGGRRSLTSTSTFSTGEWIHVVLTVDTSLNVTLYINGTSEDTDTLTGQLVDGTEKPFTFGARKLGATPDRYADGYVDEVGVWNRDLTSSEVSDLYNSGDGLSYDDFGGGAGTNLQLNIGDVWKIVEAMQINIGDVWKDVVGVQINIGYIWKEVY